MWTVYGDRAVASAHSSRNPETDWWNSSSGDVDGPDHVVVDAPWAIASKTASPVAAIPQAGPRHQKRPLGMRVEAADLAQQLAARHPRQPLAGENERHRLTVLGQALELVQRLARRRQAQDAVIAVVPVAQRLLDPFQAARVLVDRDENGCSSHPRKCRTRALATRTAVHSGGSRATIMKSATKLAKRGRAHSRWTTRRS